METAVSRIYNVNVGVTSLSEVRGIDNGDLSAMTIRPETLEFSAETIKIHEDCLEIIGKGKSNYLFSPLFFSPLSSPVENLEFPFLPPSSSPSKWKISVFCGEMVASAANVNTSRQRITTLKKDFVTFEIDAESCCLFGEWFVLFASEKPSWIFSSKNTSIQGEDVIYRIPSTQKVMGSWQKGYHYSPRHVVRHKGHLWESRGFGSLEPGEIETLNFWELWV